MARSSYVYIVHTNTRPGPLCAAFTVKHEMMTWLGKCVEMGTLNADTDWTVSRLPDGSSTGRPAVLMGQAYNIWKETVS